MHQKCLNWTSWNRPFATDSYDHIRSLVDGSFLDSKRPRLVTSVLLFRLSRALNHRIGIDQCLHAPQALQ
ncbi:hypothetical protein GALL_462430 [mine drainage metagenome]|uniref:Uncharacterized protein n=1 Tax=mine drainage metagenome TaxID=410659 RepID=A0A1J5Q864_9ZZZZ